MERLKFFKPEYLNLLWLVLPAAVILFASLGKRLRNTKDFTGSPLEQKLAGSVSRKKMILKRVIQTAAFTILIIALAGPQIGSKLVKVKRQGIDIVVAIDLSRSMQAEDIAPSRLKKTKHEVQNFINGLEGDRIALVGFTSKAFIQCPLTTDYDAALMFLDMMDTSLLPQDGTSLAEALRVSGTVFSGEEKKHKLVVLISDGEDHEEGIENEVKELKDGGSVVYTIGIGSPEGVPIPSGNGFLKDSEGNTVITKLNEINLKKIAMEGDGNYYYSSVGDTELKEIFSDISRLEKKEFDERVFKDYDHRFQLLVFLSLLLFVTDLFIGEKVKERAA